jgi:hypothetical protein
MKEWESETIEMLQIFFDISNTRRHKEYEMHITYNCKKKVRESEWVSEKLKWNSATEAHSEFSKQQKEKTKNFSHSLSHSFAFLIPISQLINWMLERKINRYEICVCMFTHSLAVCSKDENMNVHFICFLHHSISLLWLGKKKFHNLISFLSLLIFLLREVTESEWVSEYIYIIHLSINSKQLIYFIKMRCAFTLTLSQRVKHTFLLKIKINSTK